MNIVTINEVELPVLEYYGERVITLAQVDAVHGRASGTAGRNFREHRERFQDRVDFFEVTEPDEIRRLGLKRPQGGTPDRLILLTETGYMMLVKPFNDDLAWQVQRQVVTGYFAAQRMIAAAPVALTGYVADGCAIIESASRSLRLAPSATLGMYHRLADKAGHVDLLPAYAVDAPTNDDGGSSEPTMALTKLLTKYGISLSAQKVNALLLKAGLLETRSRASSKGGEKTFKCLTEAGMLYGKNVTSPQNPRETQPHFYESEFQKLLEVIGLSGLLEAA
ncbi:ORF6N domain-containing protein [Stenotrophomonas sp.]|uniref:ORF6N domain-containing protein n=1 Tax=Stenotrophomonas sp. TaxID=69392 RepID=UPI0028ABE05D|nr:ORF6N domain-containing protein [Stenotrophomonas sp.]